MKKIIVKKSITKRDPEKKLITILAKHSGRDSKGQVSVRHQGGRQKRFMRLIDWKRDKHGVAAKVAAIEYDPNRTANIALLHYNDGEKRYILAPDALEVGTIVNSGEMADIKVGNALPLSKIPIGTTIHAIELTPGRGAQVVRAAGNGASIVAKEDRFAQVKLPSGEIHLINLKSFATIGQLGNIGWKDEEIGSAGRARRMGRRPTVRGVAMNPSAHPHGGGEGRSGEGMPPKTPWGKSARGDRTRKKEKWSNKFIVSRRKK